MKKHKILLFCMIIFTIILSGCAQQSYFVQVNEDSTVNFAGELVLNERDLAKLSDLNIEREDILESKEPLFKEVKDYYSQLGFSVTYEESKQQVKVKVQKIYPSISAFNTEINSLYEKGKSGLGMAISRNSGLSGTETRYNGALKFIMDPDIVVLAKDNQHFLDYIKDTPINAYLTIYDSDDIVALETLEVGEGNFTTMTTGAWDLEQEQPLKTFNLRTESKNQVFAIAIFFFSIVAIISLLVLVFGKGKKFDIIAKLKERAEQLEDN